MLARTGEPATLGDGTLRHPGERQRGARHPRRGPLGAGVPAEDAGAGRASRWPAWPTTRSTTRTGPACRCCRTDDPQQRELHPAVDRGDAEPGRRPPRRRPALYRPYDRGVRRPKAWPRRETAWAAAQGQPGRATPPEPTAPAAAPTTTPTSPTSSTGRPPSCTSPPASRQFADDVLASPLHTGRHLRGRRLRLGHDGRARPARPGDRAEQAARPRRRCGSRCVDGRRRATWPRCRPQPYGMPYAPAEQHLRLGLQQPDPQQPGRAGDRVRHHRRRQVPRRRARGHGLPPRPQRAEPVLRHRLRRGELAEPAQPLVRPPARPDAAEPADAARSPAARTRRIQDPVRAAASSQGCAPQFCYIDDIESWSTNELTINWNSALAWMASFVADQG